MERAYQAYVTLANRYGLSSGLIYYTSTHRAGSRANFEDAESAAKRRYGFWCELVKLDSVHRIKDEAMASWEV